MIMPYLRDMINDNKATKNQSKVWKIQIFMHVNFISSKDTGENRTTYVWSDNENIMWGNETSDIIEEIFKSFLDNHQKEGQIMRGGSDFIFESIDLLYSSLNETRLKRGKSYVKYTE